MASNIKPTTPVGPSVFVDFPDLHLEKIPAKVDTGAEISAIWASNIRLEAGKLTFNFFAPGSVYYRPEPVVVEKTFRTTTIRNSFGHQEFRYKVRLKVRISGRTFARWFSLADRSRNSFPILLGKNLLKNKFIVDVSRKEPSAALGARRILVLTEQPDTKKFFKQVSKLNSAPVEYVCVPYEALTFYINETSMNVTNEADQRTDLAAYDFTFFKNHHDHEFACAAAEYLHFKNRQFVDQEFLGSMSISKLGELVRLTCNHLPVPPTICSRTTNLLTRYDEICNELGLPFVLKEAHSDKGKDNYLIRRKADFISTLKKAPETSTYLAQKYIQNDGFYRVYVFGKDVRLAVWRSSVPHDDPLKAHLNKPKGGANASNINLDTLPGEVHDLAVRAAIFMNRQVAGVDLVQDKTTRKWYILEVNNDPQVRSGSFVSEKIRVVANYFDKELDH